MLCPVCKSRNFGNSTYCSNCGSKLSVICSTCGAEIDLDSQFCSQCGNHVNIVADLKNNLVPGDSITPKKEITTSSIQSEIIERRLVSILFADLIGSAALSTTLDPEYLVDIMRDVYPCMFEPIQDHQGTIVQVMGDGVLAYFGAPSAQEDDPERAIQSGLEIVERFKSIPKQKIENQAPLFVRVGIHTGLVVVGEIHPEKHLEYIALGEAINLAARMMQNAPANSVMISHATYQHVQGLFNVIQREPIKVKGFQVPVQTYLIKGVRPLSQRLHKRGIRGIDVPMLGREAEIAALKNCYETFVSGDRSSFVLISGDPGIGKTRLLLEFVDWVKQQSELPYILRGRATSSTQNVGYGIIRYMFARKFKILETDSSTQAISKLRKGVCDYLDTDQADLVGQLIGFNFLNSPAVKKLYGRSTFSEVAKLYLLNYFRRLSDEPVLILLEDLHWIDESSLDLISEIKGKLGSEKSRHLMFVCTSRPQFFERSEKCREIIQGYRHIHLQRLSRMRSRELIANILSAVEDVPESVYDFIFKATEGNPFFIEEIIKILMEEDVIDTSDKEWQVDVHRLEDVHIPNTLAGILQARLDSLPPFEKKLLQSASVIGRTFWDGLLRELTDDPSEKRRIEERLYSLNNRGLIYQLKRSSVHGHGEYLFKHAMLHETAYASVLLKRRRVLHAQVAKWIEVNSGERLDEHFTLIAEHYEKAGQSHLAAQWTLRAADRLSKQYLMLAARKLYEKALQLLSVDDLEARWRALEGHSEAVGFLGDRESRHEDDAALLNLAQKMEDEDKIAEAYFLIGNQAYNEGDNQAALEAYDEALKARQDSGDVSLQAEILPMKIAILTDEGKYQSVENLVDQAILLAEKSGNKNIIARSLANISYYYQTIGDITRSEALMQRQIEINKELGDRLVETIGQINLGYFYLSWGQYIKGQDLLNEALKSAQIMEARRLIAYSLLNLGLAGWRLKRTRDARESLAQCLPKLKALNDQRGLASRAFYLGLVCEECDELNEAIEAYQYAASKYESMGIVPQMIEANAGIARVALNQNKFSLAVKIVQEISSYLEQEGPQGFEFPIQVYLTCIEVLKKDGHEELFKNRLKEGHELLQSFLRQIKDPNWRKVFLEDVPENFLLMRFVEDAEKASTTN